MKLSRIHELRTELDHERISYGELAEISSAYEELDPATLSGDPEDASAVDMLNELESVVTVSDKMLTTAEELTDRTISDLISDRDDPYYNAMSSEWYDEQIAALRAAKFTVLDTPTLIGLSFTRTGIIVANTRLESIMEAAVVNNLPQELTDSDPAVFTATELYFAK